MRAQTFQAFLDSLEKSLSDLPHSHQLAFAAACCERAYPNYERFSEQEGWGDADALRSSIDAGWSCALVGEIAETDLATLLAACTAATPDTDSFHPKTDTEAVLITAAQEAAFMVTLLLEFCHDKNPRYGVRIASFARDTVDMQVQIVEGMDPADPNLQKRIDAHSLMFQELEKQQNDLSELEQIKDGLLEFRRRATSPPQSNIGIKSRHSDI